MRLNIHVDGGSRGNPGPAAAGVVIAPENENEEALPSVHEAGYFLGKFTNNVAEYQGLIRALQIVGPLKAEEVCIYSDSELMVRQITGEYRVKSPDLIPLFTEAQKMLLKLDSWQIKHVYREGNKRADELVNMALDAERDVIVKDAANPNATPPVSPLKLSGDPEAAQVVFNVFMTGKGCPHMSEAAFGKSYEFGPLTPGGLCVHAADAVFDCNPLHKLGEGQRKLSTACSVCGAGVRIELKID